MKNDDDSDSSHALATGQWNIQPFSKLGALHGSPVWMLQGDCLEKVR